MIEIGMNEHPAAHDSKRAAMTARLPAPELALKRLDRHCIDARRVAASTADSGIFFLNKAARRPLA
jgi:hypothetical protein